MAASTYRAGRLFRGVVAGCEPPSPTLAGRTPFRRAEKVLERDVDERPPRLSKDVVAVDELAGDVDPAAALVLDVRADQQLGVDRDRAAKVDEEPPGDGREAEPRGEQAASLVERGGDEPAVGEPRRSLGALVELEVRLVLRQPFPLRPAQVD